MRELLSPVLDALPPGEPRVRAWLLLAESGVARAATEHAALERALDAAGDGPGAARARARVQGARTAAEGVERIPEAEAWALEALPELDALRALGWARALRGRDIDGVCAQFERPPGRART